MLLSSEDSIWIELGIPLLFELSTCLLDLYYLSSFSKFMLRKVAGCVKCVFEMIRYSYRLHTIKKSCSALLCKHWQCFLHEMLTIVILIKRKIHGCESFSFQQISSILKIFLCQSFSFFFNFQPIFGIFTQFHAVFPCFLSVASHTSEYSHGLLIFLWWICWSDAFLNISL